MPRTVTDGFGRVGVGVVVGGAYGARSPPELIFKDICSVQRWWLSDADSAGVDEPSLKLLYSVHQFKQLLL